VQPTAAPPALRADEGDLDRAASRAWQLLLAANNQPWLFRVAGLPGWIVPDDDGRPVAAMLTEERLRLMLAKLALWRRLARNGDLVPAHPPTPVIKCVLATPDPDLPVLTGIVTAPVFGRGGALLTSPGYHPDARLYYHAMPGFDLPPIVVQPGEPSSGSSSWPSSTRSGRRTSAAFRGTAASRIRATPRWVLDGGCTAPWQPSAAMTGPWARSPGTWSAVGPRSVKGRCGKAGAGDRSGGSKPRGC
jgi:hypothetical protein